jgi:hypothetical protein
MAFLLVLERIIHFRIIWEVDDHNTLLHCWVALMTKGAGK